MNAISLLHIPYASIDMIFKLPSLRTLRSSRPVTLNQAQLYLCSCYSPTHLAYVSLPVQAPAFAHVPQQPRSSASWVTCASIRVGREAGVRSKFVTQAQTPCIMLPCGRAGVCEHVRLLVPLPALASPAPLLSPSVPPHQGGRAGLGRGGKVRSGQVQY